MDRFCRACGAELRTGDRFCGACGAGVLASDADADVAVGGERTRFQEVFAAAEASGIGDLPPAPAPTDDPARQRFRETFATPRAGTPAPRPGAAASQTSGGAASLAIAVVTILAAIVFAPIGLGVLIFGGILAVVVGMSFAGAGSGVRSGDQSLAVAGTIVGAGEVILGLLAVLA